MKTRYFRALILLIFIVFFSAGGNSAATVTSSRSFKSSSATVNNLSLKQALILARQQNEQILAARANLSAAKYKTYESLTAMLPQVSASYSYIRLNDVPSITMPAYNPYTNSYTTKEIEMGKPNNYDAKLSISQPIFMWGKLYNAYRISALSEENTRLEYASTAADIAYRVKVAYYSALLAQEQLHLAEDSLNQIKLHYDSVKKRYDLGLASNLDLIQVEVKLSDARQMLISAKNSFRITMMNLKTLVGLSQADSIVLNEKFEPVQLNFNEQQVIQQVLQRDKQLQKLRNNLKILDLNTRMLKVKNLPNVLGTFNLEYKNPYNFRDEWGKNYSFGIVVSSNIFNGGSTLTQLKQIDFQKKALEYSIKGYEKMLKLQVRSLLSDIHSAAEKLEVAKLQLKQAQEAYDVAREQYENGLISNLDFLNTQLMLQQARINKNLAIFQYNQKIFEIQKLLQEDEED